MRFLLDTNVLSELRKGERADPGVAGWFARAEPTDLVLSVLTLGEIRLGIERLRQRDPTAAGQLELWLRRLERVYERRVLPVDHRAADTWARMNAVRSLPVIDSLMAATARVHGLTFVTRNAKDLEGVEVELLNPFSG